MKTILLVDDDPQVRTMFGLALPHCLHLCRLATSFAQRKTPREGACTHSARRVSLLILSPMHLEDFLVAERQPSGAEDSGQTVVHDEREVKWN
jgi:hypothetical protein